MKYFEIFYNASQIGLSGKPGFGVRTATAGIPSEYISAINDEAYHSYNCGTFTIGNAPQILLDNPKKIFDYPVRYYYRHIVRPGKQCLYALARVVSAGFDHSFYSTGKMSRTGNFIAHIFMFEECPSKEIFEILYDQPSTGSNQFLPIDYSPSLGNKEMLDLMIGNPTPLTADQKPFVSSNMQIPTQSFDLLFEYLESRKQGVPLVVKTKATDAAKICAGLFRLLPPSIVGDTTFEINHQAQGTAVGAKITFINEYYAYQIPASVCHLVDCISGTHQLSQVEAIYRAELINTVKSGNLAEINNLSEWIFSANADQYLGKSKEFNLALFKYCYYPDNFCMNDITTNEGLLAGIKSFIDKSADSAQCIHRILKEPFTQAKTIDEFRIAIQNADKVERAGINIAPVKDLSKKTFTNFFTSAINNLSNALRTFGRETLDKYGDLSLLPTFDEKADEILSLPIDLEQKKNVISLLEPDSEKRMKVYIKTLKKNPNIVTKIKDFLLWDKAESDQINYYEEFPSQLDNSLFAYLFLEQDFRRFNDAKFKDELMHFKSMCQKNKEYDRLFFSYINNTNIYRRAYTEMVRLVKNKETKYREEADFIKEYVTSFIHENVTCKKDWQRLYDVLCAKFPIDKCYEYYKLAKEIGCDEAMNLSVMKCLSYVSEDQGEVDEIVSRILDNNLSTSKDLLTSITHNKMEERTRRHFLVSIAKKEKFTTEEIDKYCNIPAFGLHTPKERNSWIKVKFSELVASQKKERIKQFAKKNRIVLIISSFILVLAIATAVYFIPQRQKPGDTKDQQSETALDSLSSRPVVMGQDSIHHSGENVSNDTVNADDDQDESVKHIFSRLTERVNDLFTKQKQE